jgi:hypothetical protein
MFRTIIAISTAITLSTLSGAQAAVQTVEADNGEVYHIVQITHGRGGQAAADVSAPDGNLNISFDCDGQMTVYSYGAHAFGPMQYVPPRSVAGRIAAIACGSIPRN